jgi:hypothetical protein
MKAHWNWANMPKEAPIRSLRHEELAERKVRQKQCGAGDAEIQSSDVRS